MSYLPSVRTGQMTVRSAVSGHSLGTGDAARASDPHNVLGTWDDVTTQQLLLADLGVDIGE
jgi:hypothetical protein